MLNNKPKITRRGRRWIVAGYYAAVAVLLVPTEWMIHGQHWILFLLLASPLSFFYALLGKICIDGSVRPLRFWWVPFNLDKPPLSLTVEAGRSNPEARLRFDERDYAVRNRAHFLANSYMVLIILAFFAVISIAVSHPAWLGPIAFVGAWLLLVLAMTLPQAILLWTEPDPEPEAELETGIPDPGAAR